MLMISGQNGIMIVISVATTKSLMNFKRFIVKFENEVQLVYHHLIYRESTVANCVPFSDFCGPPLGTC